ncbi:hypothetical protein HK102_012573, partial [Quaeritorhiza haematococci]
MKAKEDHQRGSSSGEPLGESREEGESVDSVLERINNKISTYGFISANTGNVLCFVCVGIIVFLTQGISPASGFGMSGYLDGSEGVAASG